MSSDSYIMFTTARIERWGDPPLELTIQRGNGDYMNLKFIEGEAIDLMQQIQVALNDMSPVPTMEWGDLGLTDPDDILF